MQLVLSLFPGIGLLDMAFEQEGFCVVRGPDVLWGGDIRRFHPPAGKFDGVIGGPPCQCFSELAKLVKHNGDEPRFGNLIPEFERCISEAEPDWFLMENVENAPVPDCPGWAVWFKTFLDFELGGITQRRRRFSFGVIGHEEIALNVEHKFRRAAYPIPYPAVVCDARQGSTGGRIRANDAGSGMAPHEGKSLSVEEMARRQGLSEDFLKYAPFTAAGKKGCIGNGVPLPMGRAIAKAVKEATSAPRSA